MEYGFFDGDEIGNTIEQFLLDGQVLKASELSSNINLAMEQIKNLLDQYEKYEILIWGGDDLLFKSTVGKISTRIIEKIREIFLDKTNCTMSGGLGDDIPKAMKGLGIAKNTGKNKVIKV